MDNSITVISGLPRSGTSLMMQMLAASNVPLLYDQERVADDNNPVGFYEYAPVKSLYKDQSWLSIAQGKAVKIVSPLLFFLPSDFKYRVIIMERPLSQIVASQLKMANKDLTKAEYEVEASRYYSLYTDLLIKIDRHIKVNSNFETCIISHNSLLTNPIPELKKVACFLGRELDLELMSSAIRSNLFRSK